MNQHELDALYEKYKKEGLKERCPANPGPERAAWNRKRMYLACRLYVEMTEGEAPEHYRAEAASRVGIAVRQPGWAAMEGGFIEAMQEVFNKADEDDLLESDMTHFSVEVAGRWGNEDKEYQCGRNVTFSARMQKEEDGEDES